MKIDTRDFGEVDIQQEDIIRFKQPIYGFEHLTEYVFLFEKDSTHMVWLQSVEEKEICFVLLDPAVAGKTYGRVPQDVRRQLGEGTYMYWLIAVVGEDFKKTTVNLKSPIVVNTSSHLAVQAILEESLPIRHPLFKNGKERA